MRLATAGSVLFVVPHVAGFAVLRPTSLVRRPPQPPTPAACRSRHAALPVAHHPRSETMLLGLPRPCSRQGCPGDRACHRRPSWASRPATSTRMTRAMAATQRADVGNQLDRSSAAAGRGGGEGPLRLAIVGANADELGVRIAERYGLAAKSMDELMKGRKGRKTDLVKAKAASQWLAEEGAAGAILTGFPTTVAQAESLETTGVAFEQLVVVHDRSEQETSGGADEGVSDLLTRCGEKAVEIAANADVDKLCDFAAPLLVLARGNERSLGGPATRAADASQQSVEEDVAELNQFFAEAPGGASLERVDSDEEVYAEAPGGASLESVDSDEEVYSLSEQTASMSPSERILAEERDPAAFRSAAMAAKTGAEEKRAAKEAIKKKKREANLAQQMDTPFYVAVAQGQPKSRYRPPPPTIPSRITERLSSAATAPDSEGGASNTRLDFGPLALDSPASDCLLAAGITEPTGIQQAGMGPIRNGESVILHAMTGSGKTLTFLLPLIQRWAPALFSPAVPASGPEGGFQVVLALPTRELAVQVAREVVLLAGGVTASVELLVDSSVLPDLSTVTAPIVVGSAKVLERVIRKSHPAIRAAVLPRIKAIVVDEVDRLVDVLSKHAPPKEVEKRKRHARPIAALLERVIQAKPDVQIVACSATIGRPLRRELGHIVRRSHALGSAASGSGSADDEEGTERGRSELSVIRDQFEVASVHNLATNRAVAIPDTIRHYCVPLEDGEFFSRLEALTAAVRELQPRRPLIFVPPDERVTAVVAHLRRAGGDIGRRAVALHEAMGFVSDGNGDGSVRASHSSEAIQQHDELARQFRGGANGAGAAIGVGDGDLLSGSGEIGRLGGKGEAEAGALLVTGEDSARGLHFDDVDFVFLMQKPKSPDEYVHLAGRTGRQGKTGSVVSLVAFEEFRKLQAWSSSLKVHFEPLDILNVVKR